MACGRRYGKTTLEEDRLVHPALRGLPVAHFAPTYKMMAEVWRDMRRTLAPVIARVNAQQHRLELITGGVVEMWSLDTPDVARGRKYARVTVDEAAMIRHLEEAWTAVIRPTLADYQGDAWIASSPKGRNYFYRMYQLGQDPNEPDWASWQLPTAANPYIVVDEIEAMRRQMPERTFNQEVLAVFLESGDGVFRRIRDAVSDLDPTPTAGHDYVIGIDWGKQHDFTVITVLDTFLNAVVAVDRFNQIDYAVQMNRAQALIDRYHPISVVVERNSMGEVLVEQAQRRGWPVEAFTTTAASKRRAIDDLALAFEQGTLRIPDEAWLIDELEAYDMERLPSGLLRYGAPSGMHDDGVMSLAIAWHGANGGMSVDDDAIDRLMGFVGR